MRILAGHCGLLLILAIGCQRSSSEPNQLGQQFVLAEEPGGAAGIAETREALEPEQDQELVIVGRIGAGDFEPWAEGQAQFLLGEFLPDSDHAATPGHDPANCPFCRRRAEKANATALVQFRDDAGKVIPIDARELLGVEKNQVVVIRGRGHVDKLGTLVVSAAGIHVRR